ncbi:MAG: MarR family EPS-associated transcriptional regulator [Chitinispirillaceae bacterium]
MIEYKVIKELELNPTQTQRSLARRLGISLGKLNYVMSGLTRKGVIKARKLKNHPDRVRWQYILTPEGVREKLRITRDYLNRRLHEFDLLQDEINELKREVASQSKTGLEE